ncbi:MAG: DNA topoisomerase III [Spongiibacteraceae bacterium]
MKLYIAEKPSLGRAIADNLPKPHRKAEGCIYVGNGDCVSWCIGHLLEQAEPDAYDPAFKKWAHASLPIIPQTWKLSPKPKTRKQLTVLRQLIKKADQLIHVGDPDREGQLLIDEVINYCGVPKTKIAQIKRCLVNDLNPAAVKHALNNLRDNTEFAPLSTSALARSRADWLYGINMTRLCTLQGQQSGFKGVLSIGRVQTPILGLVVKRDLEIENFVSKPFYELDISLKTLQAYQFTAKWQPSEACQPYMDEENRVLSRKLVENVAARVINQQGIIDKFSESIKKQAPPLPYNLSALQIDAAKRFRLSAKQVLDTCQTLYERHKLITYPRSDCRYLPSDHFSEASQVLAAITSIGPELGSIADAANLQSKSKAWNDKKISAHHAIIPTSKKINSQQLSAQELKIYLLIARQYLMQFLPSFDYRQIQLQAIIKGGVFVAKRKEVIALGWKLAQPKITGKDDTDKHEFSKDSMPALKKGEPVECIETNILDKNTTPPKRFNDASLLAAMTGIARYVSDPEIRKVLRDTDGLGTEATRANIIELLFTRNFLTRIGKDIHSTDIGRELITNLPSCVSLPDMTAQWEAQLNAISQRELSYQHFMTPMTNTLSQLIIDVSQIRFSGLQGKGKALIKKRRKKKASSIKKTA